MAGPRRILTKICGMAGKSRVQLCGALSPVLHECEVCNRGIADLVE